MTTPCVSSGNDAGSLVVGVLTRMCAHTHTHTLTLPPALSGSAPWPGSLWDPNITAEALEAHQLQVHFTLWNESAQYQILLTSFPHTENRSCFHRVLMVPEVRPALS